MTSLAPFKIQSDAAFHGAHVLLRRGAMRLLQFHGMPHAEASTAAAAIDDAWLAPVVQTLREQLDVVAKACQRGEEEEA